MTTNSVISYIENASLAIPADPLLLDADFTFGTGAQETAQTDVAQATVVDSNIVTYPKGTSPRVKNLVSTWLLFAQRAASGQADRNDTRAWVDAYHQVLLDTGWVQRGDAEAWTEEGVEGSTVHQQILALVSVVLGPVPTALAIVTAALTGLQSMDRDSPFITLFDRRGKSATAVGFQVANCEANGDGAALQAVDFQVHAAQTMTQVLFFKFTSREATMSRRGTLLELSGAAMDAYGPAIQARVEEAVLSNIAAFVLENPDR